MTVKYLMCVVGGVALGYYLALQKMEQAYQERFDKEADDLKDYYRRKYEKKALAAENAVGAVKTYRGKPDADVVVNAEPPQSEKLPFTMELPEPAKKAAEKAELPNLVTDMTIAGASTEAIAEVVSASMEEVSEVQVISYTEFVNSETGFEQLSLTYFTGDDILADDEDIIIKNGTRDKFLGGGVLEKLRVGGEAMDDKDALYVRNPKLETELEIARYEGKYSDVTGNKVV